MATMTGTKNTGGTIGVRSLHGLGVLCALVAGMWLGAAEAPTKLVDSGIGFSTLHNRSVDAHRITEGIVSAGGASLLWGTMYILYRKAYLSGMNPLSFVTVFTVGELLTMVVLACRFDGGLHGTFGSLSAGAPYLFWLFLGGFVWVVRSGDWRGEPWCLANSPVQTGNNVPWSPEACF